MKDSNTAKRDVISPQKKSVDIFHLPDVSWLQKVFTGFPACCADSKQASITCCVFSAHIGHSLFSWPEKTWLAKLRNMMVFCAVGWPSSADSGMEVCL